MNTNSEHHERQPTSRPWQVCIDLFDHGTHKELCIGRIRMHTHNSVVYSDEVAVFCGGVVEADKDGYTVRVANEDYSLIATAKAIAYQIPVLSAF